MLPNSAGASLVDAQKPRIHTQKTHNPQKNKDYAINNHQKTFYRGNEKNRDIAKKAGFRI